MTTGDIVDSGLVSAEEILGCAEQGFEKALKTKDMLLYRNAVDNASLSMIAAAIGIIILLLRLYPSLDSHSGGENVNFIQGLRLMIPYGMPLYLSTIRGTRFTKTQSITETLSLQHYPWT